MIMLAIFFFLIGVTNINLYSAWRHIGQLEDCVKKLRIDLEKHKYEHKQ